jgi:hypothetical protein
MSILTLAETKSCCFVAYDGITGDRFSFSGGAVWRVVQHWATSITGFKAATMVPESGGNDAFVLAFAGTDSLMDVAVDIAQVGGGMPPQYMQAILLATAAQRAASSRLQLAGHSLGGGLAAYCSSILRCPASTVNPAPLIGAATFSALFANNSQITNYVARGGEIVSSSPGRNPGRRVEVDSTGGLFGFITDHMLSNVAPSIPLPRKI